MSANARIRVHVEDLFLNAPKSHRTIELKEELIANLQEKYADLIVQGKEEEAAYEIVITSIGDIDELIRGLNERYIFDPEAIDRQRQRSAILISIAVGIYIISLVPLFISIPHHVLFGLAGMLTCWAIATMILIYNGVSKPKYKKDQDTLIEDFKQYTSEKKNGKAVKGSVDSIIWTSAVIIFLGGGFLTHRWNVLWLVFLLAAVVKQIVGLFYASIDRD